MKISRYFKVTISAIVVVFMLTAVTQDACAQLSKKQAKAKEKALNKEYKNKIKEYKKENWKLSGSSRTLDVALLTHYEKLTDEQNIEFVGEVSQCQSINVCKQSALNNAINRYATLASGNVKGRISSLLRADANMPQIEIDKFISAYENQVQAEVSGVLSESYSIVRSKGNMNEYKTIFILNEEKAGMACKKAFERSLRETTITVKEAEEISTFVNEGFKLD